MYCRNHIFWWYEIIKKFYSTRFTEIHKMGSEYKLIENILLQPEISSDNIDSIPSNIFSIFLTNYHCLKVFTYHLGKNSHVSSEFPAKISWIVHIWVFFDGLWTSWPTLWEHACTHGVQPFLSEIWNIFTSYVKH